MKTLRLVTLTHKPKIHFYLGLGLGSYLIWLFAVVSKLKTASFLEFPCTWVVDCEYVVVAVVDDDAVVVAVDVVDALGFADAVMASG